MNELVIGDRVHPAHNLIGLDHIGTMTLFHPAATLTIDQVINLHDPECVRYRITDGNTYAWCMAHDLILAQEHETGD